MVAATGIGSGLDIESLVTQLVAAEGAPAQNRLLTREAALTSELSAFGALQGALSTLQSSVGALTEASTFSQRNAVSSNTSAVSASATSAAATGSLSVEVSQLAQSQSLASGSFASVSDEVGEGVLTFRFGTVDVTPEDSSPQTFNSFAVNADASTASVTIDSSNNTLEGVRDAINAADAGVSAAIVNDGSGFRLLLTSTESGAANAIEVQVTDTGDGVDDDSSGLSRLAFNASANNLTQTAAGRDATFSINGLDLTSASNEVSEVLTGVSFTLQETTSTPVSLTISQNEAAVRGAINDFVANFNAFVNVANNLTAYDADTQSAGALQGDFSARSIISQIRNALSASAQGSAGAFSTLSELGIQTQSDGTLSVDDTVLSSALSSDFDSVQAVFADFGSTTDAGVSFNGATAATQAGAYAVNITQVATQSALLSATITEPTVGTPLIIDGDNDTLNIVVDGVESSQITLTQGSYTSGEDFAAELQSRINGDGALASAGAAVTVTYNADNTIEIRSDRFGSASAVEITAVDTNTAADFGFSVVAASPGLNVAGTIGGFAATGDGQVLSAASGSAAEGISLTVTGSSSGSRGTLTYSTGVATGLDALLEGFLGSDGLISLRTDGIQSSVDRIEEDRESLNLRLEALEARYRRQFNALDTLLANLQSTSNFLTTQLANIPIPGNNSDN